MNRGFYILGCACALLIGMCAPARAAQPGSNCYNAKPLGDNFNESITGSFPQTVWYTAWTFDLPLSVYFIPQNPDDEAPEIEMDFGCTTGVYSDPTLCMLFCKGGTVTLPMPHKPTLQTSTVDGQFCYYLSMGKSYRDLLLKVGIDSNVQVFVKVTYHAPGLISIAPDDMFSNCMDGYKFMHLGDTVEVVSLDKDRHVIVPYVQWQDDSIRYVWSGTAPVEVAVGNSCDYDPTDGTDEHRVDWFVLQPQDTLKMTSDDVKYYIQSDDVSSEAGMFYAKFYTSGTGQMTIERVPQAPPEGDAVLLKYDRPTTVTGDTAQLFAIPSSWTKATLFSVPTDHIFRMYIGTKYDFFLDEAIATYQFRAGDDGHRLGLAETEMQELWTNTQDKYLYIRFECTAKTTIVPSEWIMSQCEEATREIKRPSTTLMVEKGSYKIVYYRLYYREWKGGDMTFEWQSEFSKCPTFIGDTCKFTLNGSAPHVIDNMEIDELGSWTIPAVDLADYENEVDEDGYLYVRFNPGYQGTMVVSTTAPEEQDPEPVVYPAATISVSCDGEPTAEGQTFTVRVSQEQDLRLDGGDQWHQTPDETHLMTLPSGIHMLVGEEQSVRIEVK